MNQEHCDIIFLARVCNLLRVLLGCAAWLTFAACATTTERGSWGGAAHWPSGADLKYAVGRAVRDPMTWVPLAGAAVLGISGQDDDLSEWAADHRPLFGDNAADASNTLRDLTTAAYAITALAAPKPSVPDKVKAIAVGIGTMALNDSITRGIKDITNRERPNGQDDKSFPSGHASSATTRAALAAANVDYLPLPKWANTSLKVGFYSLAGGTAWARVEAEKHHVTDVLVGYALGHFLASFMQQAFLEPAIPGVALSFAPLPNGGSVSVSFAVGRSPR